MSEVDIILLNYYISVLKLVPYMTKVNYIIQCDFKGLFNWPRTYGSILKYPFEDTFIFQFEQPITFFNIEIHQSSDYSLFVSLQWMNIYRYFCFLSQKPSRLTDTGTSIQQLQYWDDNLFLKMSTILTFGIFHASNAS